MQKIATGALTADGNGTGGAVTEVDDALGMDGALCQASAIQLVGGALEVWAMDFWGYHGGVIPTKRIGTYEHLTVK